ncbi:MAG: YeiH family protein [Anaerococcus sp.]|nr:YeiH family protein [Anaerococcus sp.]
MKYIKGIILSLLIAIPSHLLGKALPVVGGPVFAIIIGMVLSNFIGRYDDFDPGIGFTSKKVLQLAVILLGFGMNISTIVASGRQSLPVIIATISVSLIASYFLTKVLNIDRKVGILIGVGSSICGGSAIAATAPVIKAEDEKIAKAISVIFLFNVLAALIFPTLGSLIGFTNEGFGLFAGTAVNDTSSVTATATAWDAIHGSNTLELATVVKLTRTLAIIPITLVLSIYENKQTSQKQDLKIYKLVPTFILLFLLASIVSSVFTLPQEFLDLTKFLSKFFITMAMGAIGLKTDLIKLIKTGGSAILLGFICWILISLTSIGVQKLIGIF